MPRQSRGSRSAPRAPPPQSRGAHTATAPAPHSGAHPSQAPPVPAQAQSSGPGIIGQMAATAGSVAIGSTLAHGLSSVLFGGSSNTPVEHQQQVPVQQQQASSQGAACSVQAQEFTKCLDKADLPSCSWYLDQLKACQAAAAQY